MTTFIRNRSTSLLSNRMRWLTRVQHRMADLINILSFTLCPVNSISTSICLPNINNNNSKCLSIEQWTSLGSGGFVWGGSRRLAEYLNKHGSGGSPGLRNGAPAINDRRSWDGLNVIELGAGTGALGLAIAAMGANVTLTDQASFVFPGRNKTKEHEMALEGRWLLDLMRLNVQNNLHCVVDDTNTTTPRQDDVQVHEMLWGNHRSMLDALPHNTYDVIVASDVLFFTPAQADLLDTLRRLSNQQTIIFIEHTDRSGSAGDVYPDDMLHFFDLLEQDTRASWHPQIVLDHGRHITLCIKQESVRR